MKLAIFCGAAHGNNAAYRQAAYDFAQLAVTQNIEVIYGGGSVGLMGVIADTVIKFNGHITGYMPTNLIAREIAHKKLSQLISVESFAERKQKIIQHADAFVILPGGVGSLDEFFEVLNLVNIGQLKKPVGILNTNGVYNNLVQLLQDMSEAGFLSSTTLELINISREPEDILKQLMHAEMPEIRREYESSCLTGT